MAGEERLGTIAGALLVTWWLARNDLAALALRDPPVWVIVASAGDEQHGDEQRGDEQRGDEQRGDGQRGDGQHGDEERGNEQRGDEERGNEERDLAAVSDSCAMTRLRLQARGEYAAGHYALALVTLEGYLGDRPEDAEAQFYAGVCGLAVGSARRARAHLGAVAVHADYRDRARFYIAQAFLLGGHRREACAALRDAADGGGKYALRAGEQLQEVEAIPAGLWRLVPWR
jgi:hypothetical protein